MIDCLSGTIKETHPILPFLNRVFTFSTPLSLAFLLSGACRASVMTEAI